jgi:hypothetical protein
MGKTFFGTLGKFGEKAVTGEKTLYKGQSTQVDKKTGLPLVVTDEYKEVRGPLNTQVKHIITKEIINQDGTRTLAEPPTVTITQKSQPRNPLRNFATTSPGLMSSPLPQTTITPNPANPNYRPQLQPINQRMVKPFISSKGIGRLNKPFISYKGIEPFNTSVRRQQFPTNNGELQISQTTIRAPSSSHILSDRSRQNVFGIPRIGNNGGSPNYPNVNYKGPNYAGPNYKGPNYSGPNYNNVNYSGPQYNGSNYSRTGNVTLSPLMRQAFQTPTRRQRPQNPSTRPTYNMGDLM